MINVKKIRSKMGLTQRDFAQLLGCHYRSVQNWEAGASTPIAIMVEKIKDMYAVFMTQKRGGGG